MAGADANIMSAPVVANPSLGLVPVLGFCITPLTLTINCCAEVGGLDSVNLVAVPFNVALHPPDSLELDNVFIKKLPGVATSSQVPLA